jgi:hypothetical protein
LYFTFIAMPISLLPPFSLPPLVPNLPTMTLFSNFKNFTSKCYINGTTQLIVFQGCFFSV